jgi:hypothetical protein
VKSAGPQSSGASATRAMPTAIRSSTARKGSDKSVTFQVENSTSSTTTVASYATKADDGLVDGASKSKMGGKSFLRQSFFMRALGISSR